MENIRYPFINLPLPYDYDALEPYIDTKTMHLHHDKHLQTYIDKLNKALRDQPGLQNKSLDQLLKCSNLPCCVKKEIKNNAGGVFNHRFYFKGMQNFCEQEPTGKLAKEICCEFGSMEGFKKEFKKAALDVFGSGYAWLVADSNAKIKITTTANQDTPIEKDLYPLVCIDVWEHAYYLKHYNERAAYVDDWMKLINWVLAQELFLSFT